jgi:glycosyltransferase involved in cell wall biosynthesis
VKLRLKSKRCQQHSLKVLVFSPPLDKSGGIGALFSYAKPHFPQYVKVTFIDTRGYLKNPIWSIFTLVKALLILTRYKFHKEVDVVHLNLGARGSAFRKIIIGIFAIFLFHIPTVYQLHASNFETFFDKLNPVIRNILLKTLNSASLILVLGSASMNMLIRIGVRKELLKSFQMGVPDLLLNNTPENLSSVAVGATRTSPVLLFAGELGERKGLPDILKSLAILKEEPLHLIATGSGDTLKWQQLCKYIGVSHRTAFPGLLSYENVHSYLRDVDALILASKAEGLPVSVLESLSAGKIVITTDAGNLTDFLNVDNSIKIESTDVAGVTQSLEKFVALFRQNQHTRLSQNARELWTKHFNVSLKTMDLVDIWKGCK